MNFEWNDEQQELRRTLRAFFEEAAPESALRDALALETPDAALWARMSQELGLPGIAIPELYGGAGCGFLDQALVLEEMGRCLVCAPYFASAVLAANALLESHDESARARWLPRIASGESVATLALAEDSGRWEASGVELSATHRGDDWWLDGHKSFVLDGSSASLLLVVAQSDSGLSLFAVDGDVDGLERVPVEAIDRSRKLARLTFRGVPGALVGVPGEIWPALERTLDLAAVALAAEQVGGAARTLEIAVEYAGVRSQFGRAVGSFQAVKHACADMLLEVEAARTATYCAAWSADEHPDELSMLASMAQARASDAYTRVAEQTIQILGGIGFTWDHPAHLYLRRARSSQMLLGDATWHRGRFFERLDLD